MPKLRARRRKATPARKARAVPYYGQTTDFTCRPSSVIMAMKALEPSVKADRAKRKARRDMTGVPIPRTLFEGVTSYGKKCERAAVLVR